jgi:hypothetical protein
MDDQEPRARADEIPELRRGCVIPRGRYLASDLPPLHTLTDIFADMASNALKMGFEHVLSRLGSRPLRVATMCSGTEAPLLALELIQTGKCIVLFSIFFFSVPSVVCLLSSIFMSACCLWLVPCRRSSASTVAPTSQVTCSLPCPNVARLPCMALLCYILLSSHSLFLLDSSWKMAIEQLLIYLGRFGRGPATSDLARFQLRDCSVQAIIH